MTALVIVESPTKARTIRGFLPQGYEVQASMGHVRDLPQSAADIPADLKSQDWARIGVNVANNFEPLYIVPKDKQKVVKELKAALKKADELILATDEDREGESISWHLLEVLKPKVPIKRMVFHEITREAIQEALAHCRQVDERLVRAQETRRILDRLVGYTLSPLLWKKIAPKLSAGRVQSVAVRLLVERERQRRAFRSGQYWDLQAHLQSPRGGDPFAAVLVSLGGKRLAGGQDFDPATGQIAQGRDVVHLNQAEAEALREQLLPLAWTVSDVEERRLHRKPAPPFTTSTLQQEANRKLRLSAQETMRIAQRLYEEGYITYMRTDSVHLSEQAIRAARECVLSKYGQAYLSPEPRQFTTKAKAAQEAHEAIRPAGSQFRLPAETGLQGRDLELYDLIWKRTVASQMAEARILQVGVHIQVGEALFRASGKRIEFPGFFRAYVEGSDDPDAALEDQEVHLPPLQVGDQPRCVSLQALGHQTQPPDRYTEAALVKTLESEGIGRPSTYASIIDTIISRGYARLHNKTLIPTFTAFAVTALLEEHFTELVDPHFTARMEETLDEIASGEVAWLPYLREFYLGEQGLERKVRSREDAIEAAKARLIQLDPDLSIGIGSYGPYVRLEKDGSEIRASLPEDIPPADLSREHVEALIKQKQEGPTPLGIDEETGLPIYVLTGRFGPYVQLGDATPDQPKPKRASLPKGLKPEQVTLELAKGLLSLPRTLGSHPVSGQPVQAGLGRFGPYVVCDGDFRSLPAGDNVLTVTLERALELLAQPKTRGRQTAQRIKDLGPHPLDQAPIQVLSGRYGPYVKHGDLNATIPKDRDPESLTLEEALDLLAVQAEKAPEAGKKKTGKAKSAETGPTKKPRASRQKATVESDAAPETGPTKKPRASRQKATVESDAAPETSPAKKPRPSRTTADLQVPASILEVPVTPRITIKSRGQQA
ncbi:MAG: type I DNA topoisomerase [Thermostichales cyanobacterium SZTDM-1c_bins_54]